MQSIPCMALLALGIPVFGIGEKLAVFMVFVYAFLPILKNIPQGIGDPRSPLEVAPGHQADPGPTVARVELPMAVPLCDVGYPHCRGLRGEHHDHCGLCRCQRLGLVYRAGHELQNYPLTLMGAVAASVMALALDFLLGRVEKAVTSEGLLPPDQIKNLSRTVRRRRRNVAWDCAWRSSACPYCPMRR